MERNREARRVSVAATNGLSRRRQRSTSLRDSPEEDGAVELQETARCRDRGNVKKDRDRDHRDRDRDRSSRSSKRRRGDRLSHREDGGDETTEESLNDDEDDYDDDDGDGGPLRILPPNPTSSVSSISNHLHRKSFPPAKVYKGPLTWKAADEMIGVSVPRKARSASTKRSHESSMIAGGNNGGIVGVGGEQVQRQASLSPVRTSLIVAASSSAPISPPSSSNVAAASARKKMKPNGPKQRPPKTSVKSCSSNQDEIEFEIAEVLYGLRQNQGPSKQEGNDSVKFDLRESNKPCGDAKSRVSSPISNSLSSHPQSSVILPQNSSSLTAIAPKRKKPRPVRCEEENPGFLGVQKSPISSTIKAEIDQPPKTEFFSMNFEKDSGSGVENGVSFVLVNSQATPSEPPPESDMLETANFSESKPSNLETAESKDAVMAVPEEGPSCSGKEPSGIRLDDNRDDSVTATKANSTVSEMENQREEKFQIDLMAPPLLRSSSESESEIEFVSVDPAHAVSDVKTEKKEDKKGVKLGRDRLTGEPEEKKVIVGEADSQKSIFNKERIGDLQLDFGKPDRDVGVAPAGGNKLHQHIPKQHLEQLPKSTRDEPNTERTAQPSGSLPLPMSTASWPGGISQMGYVGPLQGVVSMDGSAVPSMAIQPPPHSIFSQPRPKRCATHCYIARNICYNQQLTSMNSFWPPASGSGPSLYGKPPNLNVVATTDLHGNVSRKNLSSVQDNKGQGLAIITSQGGKDIGSQVANVMDAAQRKQQILLQQALPPGAPSNILHGPAIIFPLNQQQAAVAAAASARSGAVKSPIVPGSPASSNLTSSASATTVPAAAAAPSAMSFGYPNMSANEAQYLAILQNNAYPFPIPAHVAAQPPYRGTHAQAMPFFSGPFYSSPMLHPSQLQPQQQQPPAQLGRMQQVNQNGSVSTASSSSQKNVQNQQQQQRAHGSGITGGSGNLQAFPSLKNRPMQQHNQQMASIHQACQHDTEMGSEDSPSTADSRTSRTNASVYGQNFAIPIHPPNFALMTPTASSGGGVGGSHGDKRQQQQQSLKAGVEPLPSQAFGMSFASINGAATAPGIDVSSLAQNHAFLQSLPEHARHNYQIMAAAVAAQAAEQKKNYQTSEEAKTGAGDSSSNVEEERRAMAGKASATLGQSIAFSRPDIKDASVGAISGNNVIDNSARTVNLSSIPSRVSANPSNSQLQQRHQQMLQLQKQQQPYAAAAARSKTPATSNGTVHPEHLPSSSTAAKFPNPLSAFPQNLVQSNSSPAQSPQWKNARRTSTSQVASQALASSGPSSLKGVPQQQVRTQQGLTHISFGGSTKSSTMPQVQQPASSNQSPSCPVMVGSPTTSSVSKGAGGSPRTTTATSMSSKTGQASMLSSQQGKNLPSLPSRKSSPVGGRNVQSIPGNHHINSSSSSGIKPPSLQKQAQPQMSKQTMQLAQLFFSNPYVQAQAQTPHSLNPTSTASATSTYYMQQRRRPEQQQQPPGSSMSSSAGMVSLCPVTLASASTSDPAKAVAAASAAAASNMKGGGLPSQGILNASQFAATQSSSVNPHPIVPAGFPYVQSIPQAAQLKPAEQKQPAGE